MNKIQQQQLQRLQRDVERTLAQTRRDRFVPPPQRQVAPRPPIKLSELFFPKK
jgi:hypothetical protein